MTTDNSERIKACRNAIMREAYTANDQRTADTIDRLIAEHFGESAPEQKEGVAALVVVLDEWIELFREIVQSDDEDAGMTWWLNDHGKIDKFVDVLLRARAVARAEPLAAPSVNRDAEVNPYYEQLSKEFKLPCGHFTRLACTDACFQFADIPQEPTCACGHNRAAHFGDAADFVNESICGLCTDPPCHKWRPIVESSVLPSKSERE